MNKEVEAKLDRLCSFYLEAQGRLAVIRPARVPPLRVQRRHENEIAGILDELIQARKPRSAAVVRLAYVRAMREVRPEARLGPNQELEVSDLVDELDNILQWLEIQALMDYRHHVRRLVLGKTMRHLGNSPAADHVERLRDPLALEQHARTRVRSVIGAAEMAGALAGTHSGDYDGAVNA